LKYRRAKLNPAGCRGSDGEYRERVNGRVAAAHAFAEPDAIEARRLDGARPRHDVGGVVGAAVRVLARYVDAQSHDVLLD
jgi:hypothetical protein